MWFEIVRNNGCLMILALLFNKKNEWTFQQ